MKTQGISAILLLLALAGAIHGLQPAGSYDVYEMTNKWLVPPKQDTFTVGTDTIYITGMNASATYYRGLCRVSGAYATVKINANGEPHQLTPGQNISFSADGAGEFEHAYATFELTSLNARYGSHCSYVNGTISVCGCDFDPIGSNYSFAIKIRKETYGCSDADYSDPKPDGNATSAVIHRIWSNKTATINWVTLLSETTATFTDSCINATHQLEYQCYTGDKAINKTYYCGADSVCSAGRCVKADMACVDSDGGDVSSAGTVKTALQKEGVSAASGAFEDSCLDESTVREFICSGNEMAEFDMSCPQGTKCSGGKCAKLAAETEQFCQDSDGGNATGVRGTVREGTRDKKTLAEISVSEKEDECTSADTLREYVCEVNVRKAYDLKCASGEACEFGRCAKKADAGAPATPKAAGNGSGAGAPGANASAQGGAGEAGAQPCLAAILAVGTGVVAVAGTAARRAGKR